jgi:hypothetical protein
MNVTYHGTTEQMGIGSVLLQQGTNHLEEVLGPSAQLVTAEWNQSKDEQGRVFYTLKIADRIGEVQASFTPDELKSSANLRDRLSDLWGDLLQRRSHTQLQELWAAVEGS